MGPFKPNVRVRASGGPPSLSALRFRAAESFPLKEVGSQFKSEAAHQVLLGASKQVVLCAPLNAGAPTHFLFAVSNLAEGIGPTHRLGWFDSTTANQV